MKIECAVNNKVFAVSLIRDGKSISDTLAEMGLCKKTYRQWKASPVSWKIIANYWEIENDVADVEMISLVGEITEN